MLVWLGKTFWNREGSLGRTLWGVSWCHTGGVCITGHSLELGVYVVCGRVKNRGPWERREPSGWKGRLGSKGSGRVVNGRPEECVQTFR